MPLDPFDIFDWYDAARAAWLGWRCMSQARRLSLVYAVEDAVDQALAQPWARRASREVA